MGEGDLLERPRMAEFDGRADGDKKNNSRRRKDRWPIRSFRANNYCINYSEGSVRIYDVSKIRAKKEEGKKERKKEEASPCTVGG